MAASVVSCLMMAALSARFVCLLVDACAEWAESTVLTPRNVAYCQVLAVTQLCGVLAFASVAIVFGHSAKTGSLFAGFQSICLGAAGVLLIVRELVGYYGIQAVFNSSKPPTMTGHPAFDVTVFGLGVFLICLAVVFCYGGLIEADSNGTV